MAKKKKLACPCGQKHGTGLMCEMYLIQGLLCPECLPDLPDEK